MTAIGRHVYGVGVIGLGLVTLVYGAFDPNWLSVSTHVPGYHLLAYAAGAGLVLAGAAIHAPRAAAVSALSLAAFFAAPMLLLELPQAVAKPTAWIHWQSVAESTAMALGGVLAYVLVHGAGGTRSPAVAKTARLVFGACLLIFGVSHFVYARFTAALVPAWLPPSQLTWTYATGAAQIAAGVAMLSGIYAPLAAVLLTVMYAGFGVLVHIPSVIATPWSQGGWTENAINLILTGAAWCLSDTLRRAKEPL